METEFSFCHKSLIHVRRASALQQTAFDDGIQVEGPIAGRREVNGDPRIGHMLNQA